MYTFAKNGESICLLGDFNAKTGNLPDFVQPDEALLENFDLYDDPDLISYMYDYENLLRANLPLNRKSTCTSRPNSFGHKLLDFCRKNNIYIVNGRAGKDGTVGERTCKDLTTIDFCLCSSDLLFYISEFEIMEYSPMFSDVQRPLHLMVNCLRVTEKPSVDDIYDQRYTRSKRWDSEKRDEFVNRLVEDDMFSEINFMIDELDNLNNVNDEINSILDKISKLLTKRRRTHLVLYVQERYKKKL